MINNILTCFSYSNNISEKAKSITITDLSIGKVIILDTLTGKKEV